VCKSVSEYCVVSCGVEGDHDRLEIAHESRVVKLADIDKVPLVVGHLFSFPLSAAAAHREGIRRRDASWFWRIDANE
jgi:hypothetical protein